MRCKRRANLFQETSLKKSFVSKNSADLMCCFFLKKTTKAQIIVICSTIAAWCFNAACTPHDCGTAPQSPSFALQITLISGHSGEAPLKAPGAFRALITEMFLLSLPPPSLTFCSTNRQGQRSRHHFLYCCCRSC